MPSTPAIQTTVTITTKDINNDSVANVFNNVRFLSFDYFKGMVNIVDGNQGSFFFPLLLVTTVTYTVAGSVTTVVIS
jgi:hypothetical protein